VVADELLVGNRVIAGNKKHAERSDEHPQRKENNGYEIATLLHTYTLTQVIGRKASGRRAIGLRLCP
jgi:hypothetical protein